MLWVTNDLTWVKWANQNYWTCKIIGVLNRIVKLVCKKKKTHSNKTLTMCYCSEASKNQRCVQHGKLNICANSRLHKMELQKLWRQARELIAGPIVDCTYNYQNNYKTRVVRIERRRLTKEILRYQLGKGIEDSKGSQGPNNWMKMT